MDNLRKAAQEALEALESLQGGCTDSDDGTVEALTVWCPEIIDDLRAALAEPQPEPDEWNFPIFSEWWDAHGKFSESSSRDLAKLAWEVSRERAHGIEKS